MATEAASSSFNLPAEPHPIATRASELLIRQDDRSLELPEEGIAELKVRLAEIAERPEELLHAVLSLSILINWVRDDGSPAMAEKLGQLTAAATTGPMMMQAALLSSDKEAEKAEIVAKLIGQRERVFGESNPEGKPAWTLEPVASAKRRA